MKEMKTIANLADVEADQQTSNTIDQFTNKIISNAPQGSMKTEILVGSQESTGVVTRVVEVDLKEDVENSEAATGGAEISQCEEEVAVTSHLEVNVVEDAEISEVASEVNQEVASEENQEEATTINITTKKTLIVTTNTLPIIATTKDLIEKNQTKLHTFKFEA